MVEAQNKVVSIEAFRATRPAAGGSRDSYRESNGSRPQPSPRNIEHSERMLRFLKMEAVEARATQGRLLL
jgi:hypothetical protein